MQTRKLTESAENEAGQEFSSENGLYGGSDSLGFAPELAKNPALLNEKIPEGGLASLRKNVVSAPSGQPMVRAISLTKRYAGTLALDDVNLTLYPGEIFGLVGPNGAGKSTLLRILATLTKPDSGEVTICGYSLKQVKEVRACIGFMPDVLGVYDDMLVREYFEFFARATNLPESTRDYAIEETMKAVRVDVYADQPVDGLSRGMKQRLCLGRTILHSPKLLLLDEPASGLDPLARLELRETLRGLQRQGVTVVISSHVLEDLADICDRVGMVSRGRIVRVQETREFIKDEGGRRLRLQALGRSEELFSFLNGYSRADLVRWDNESVVCRMADATEADLAALLKDVVLKGIPLIAFKEEEPSLESAYLNVTGGLEKDGR